MNDITRITKECDFIIRIRARRIGYNRYVNISWDEISALAVKLINMPAEKIAVSHTIDSYGRLIVNVVGNSLVCNTYGIEVTGYYNNGNWRHQIAPAFEIVNNSTEENYALNETDDCTIDFSITLGETYVSTRVFDNEVKKIDKAAQDITRLQEDVANAGKVDDVKVNGVSVVSSKEANISIPTKVSDLQNDSEFVTEPELEEALGDAGHVDDVKVNGSSVVSNKEANITVPTDLKDLNEDSTHRTVSDSEKALWGAKQEEITAIVNPTIEEDGGDPAVEVDFESGQLEFAFKNLKGPKGDSVVGPQGPQGDSVLVNQGDLPLAHTPGSDNTKAISQKGATQMYDSEELYEGWGYTGSKYIKKDNTEGSGSAYAYTDYIPLTSLDDDDRLVAETLKVNTAASPTWYAGNYYDANKQVITSEYINSASIDIAKRDMPAGAEYVRLNYTNQQYPTIKFIRCGKTRIDNAQTRLNAFDRKKIVVSTLTASKYIKSADGTTATDSKFKCTGYIDIQGATAVHSSQGSLRAAGNTYGQITSAVATIAFYDSSKNFISNTAAHFKYAECPANAKYIRCTVPTAAASTEITLYDVSSNSQLDSVIENVNKVSDAIATGLEGKRVAFIGDSITYGTAGGGVSASNVYHKIFADLIGCTNVNLGENGSTIASGTGRTTFVSRATAENLSNVDMVVIFGGTNDFTYDIKPIGPLFEEETITTKEHIGNKRKIAPTDTQKFAGALHDLINSVRSIIGEKPIILMTPLNRGRYTDSTYTTTATSVRPSSRDCNPNGDFLMDFVNAIKEIGRFYAIPVFDCGGIINIDPTDRTSASEFTGDLLHPNDKGHERLGKLLYKFVCQNIVL